MSREDAPIEHPGIITKIEGRKASVMILSQSACVSCQAKGACNMSEMEEKNVEVELPEPALYQTGQQVNVIMKQSQGNLAVLLGYVLPFAVLLVTLIVLISAGIGEGVSGLVSLSILVPYYFILYRFKGKLQTTFSFSLEPIS